MGSIQIGDDALYMRGLLKIVKKTEHDAVARQSARRENPPIAGKRLHRESYHA